jgi:hypothetical protein
MKFWSICVACFLSIVFIVSAKAAVVLYDDFEDGTLNTSIWTNTSGGSGSAVETGGQLKLQSNGGYYTNRGGVISKSTVTLQPGQTVVWSSTWMESQEYAADNYWGFVDDYATLNNVIRLGTSYSDSSWLCIWMRKDGGTWQKKVLHDTRYIENGWSLEWSYNRVVVRSVGWGVIFDSANPSLNGGIKWNVPAVGKSMYFFAEAQANYNWIKFNDMKVETVPEAGTDYVVYDDFDDGVLNTSLWTNTSGGGTLTESGGKITLQANGGYYANRGAIRSNGTATLTAGKTVLLSSLSMEMQEWGAYNVWGLSDASGSNQIYIYTDDSRNLAVRIRTNGVNQDLANIQDTRYIENGWSIAWSEGRVVVTSDTWGVRFDSADPTKNGGISWNIPAVGTSMYAFAEAQLNSNWMWFSDMYLRVVRTPGTIADSFDTGSLDTLYWTNISENPGYAIANPYGQFEMNAVVSGSYRYQGGIQANPDYWIKPEAGRPVEIVLENVRDYRQFIGGESVKDFYAQMYNNGTFGSGGTAVLFALNTGYPNYEDIKFTITNVATGFDDYVNPWIDPVWGIQKRTDGTWKILWEVDRIRLYHNGELAFDTATDAGVKGTQPGQWPIPTIPMGLNIKCTWPNAQGKFTIDSVYCGPQRPAQKGDLGYLNADIDNSCTVDYGDIAEMADQWLQNTNPAMAGHIDNGSPTTIVVPAATVTPTLDGVKDAGEWADAVAVSFNGLEPMNAPGVVGGGVHALPYEVLSLSDLSATAYLKYDNNYLYVGVEVTDDIILYNYVENLVWAADSVEVYFDLNNDRSQGFADANENFPDKCTKGLQCIALCGADPVGYPDDNQTNPMDPTNTYHPETWWQGFGTWPLPSSGTYFVEFKFSRQNMNLQTGQIYGFDIAINDSDISQLRTSILTYQGGNSKTEAPFAAIVLGAKSSCGTLGYFDADLDRNCIVNLADFAVLAEQWLGCTDPDTTKCSAAFVDCELNPELCK